MSEIPKAIGLTAIIITVVTFLGIGIKAIIPVVVETLGVDVDSATMIILISSLVVAFLVSLLISKKANR